MSAISGSPTLQQGGRLGVAGEERLLSVCLSVCLPQTATAWTFLDVGADVCRGIQRDHGKKAPADTGGRGGKKKRCPATPVAVDGFESRCVCLNKERKPSRLKKNGRPKKSRFCSSARRRRLSSRLRRHPAHPMPPQPLRRGLRRRRRRRRRQRDAVCRKRAREVERVHAVRGGRDPARRRRASMTT